MQRPLLFGVRRDLISGTSGKCTTPKIRTWQLTPPAARRQRLIHTNPRSTAPATSTNSAAPLAAPHSTLAAVTDTPQRAALGNCQLYVSQAYQSPRSQSRRKLKLQQQRAVVNHNASSFDGSAHLCHRRVHSHPHCVAARLQFCSTNLHSFLHNLTGSPHRRRILMISDCMIQLPHQLGIVGARCNVEECRPILRSRPHAAPPQG